MNWVSIERTFGVYGLVADSVTFASAQTGASSIAGVVTDPQGKPVPGQSSL